MSKAAGFVIFRKIGAEFEYLLLQASYANHHWTPPKGHLEGAETEMDAALRETREEVGFKKEDLKIYKDFKKVLKYTVNNKQKTVVYWLAELYKNNPVVLSSEHQDYKWLNLSEASKLSEYSNFQNMLKECEDFLSKNYKKG